MKGTIAPNTQFTGVAGRTPYLIDRFIAAGGEGEVYALKGKSGYVGKIYRQPMDRAKVKKLAAMIQCRTETVANVAAWPVDILKSNTRQPVGIVMPYIANAIPLHLITNPKTRLKHRPDLTFASLVRIAQNLASAVSTLHRAGVVIGDLNGQNFFVQQNGTVRAIDCDSMQIGGNIKWSSNVGVEEYIASELQGKSLEKVLRTRDHDNFALAILLFELLVLGRHPFVGNSDLGLGEAIKQGRHLFSTNGPKRNAFSVLGIKPTALLTPELIELYKAAFARPQTGLFKSQSQRPDAAQWAVALAGLANQLKTCPANAGHHYSSAAGACLWCEMEARKIPQFFKRKAHRVVAKQSSAHQEIQEPASSLMWLIARSSLRLCLWLLRLVWRIVCLTAASVFDLATANR